LGLAALGVPGAVPRGVRAARSGRGPLERSWGPDPIQSRRGRADPSSKVIVMDSATLKEQIESGEYRVDPAAVADALLRRLQNECWYPASGPSASMNTNPAGPSATEPIQVTLLRALALRAGTQTHNS